MPASPPPNEAWLMLSPLSTTKFILGLGLISPYALDETITGDTLEPITAFDLAAALYLLGLAEFNDD